MTLNEYLAFSGKTRTELAATLGVSGEAVRLWLLKERTPSPEQLRAIADLSGGQVTPNDFILGEQRFIEGPAQ